MDYGYARVSTIDQNLDLQRDAFKRFGLDPDDPKQVIEEKRSGAKDRPKFNALLGQLQPGDSLSVWKLDRLGCTIIEVITNARDLLERGVTVRILKDGLILEASSAWGKFQLSLLAAVAELERDLIIERTRDGKAAARARGKYQGGARLYGWTSKPDEDGNFQVIDAEATIVKELASRVLKPQSLSAITRDLKSRQIPASTGGGWKPSTIRSLLTNPRTAGIIGAKTHRDLLRLFADTKERKRQGRPSPHLLTGIIRCQCGARMYINPKAGGQGNPQYRCLHSLSWQLSQGLHPGCPPGGIRHQENHQMAGQPCPGQGATAALGPGPEPGSAASTDRR
jgi:DNA invertase Pin-like site-specific DNA recombinase